MADGFDFSGGGGGDLSWLTDLIGGNNSYLDPGAINPNLSIDPTTLQPPDTNTGDPFYTADPNNPYTGGSGTGSLTDIGGLGGTVGGGPGAGGGSSGGGSGGGAGGTPSDTSGSSLGSDLLKAVGGWPGLLSMLGLLGGGIYAANATKNAANQTVQGINNANQALNTLLGPTATGGGNYAPYIGAGQSALGKLGGFNYQPLAPQFGNLSTGGVNALPKQLTLGMLAGGK